MPNRAFPMLVKGSLTVKMRLYEVRFGVIIRPSI